MSLWGVQAHQGQEAEGSWGQRQITFLESARHRMEQDQTLSVGLEFKPEWGEIIPHSAPRHCCYPVVTTRHMVLWP